MPGGTSPSSSPLLLLLVLLVFDKSTGSDVLFPSFLCSLSMASLGRVPFSGLLAGGGGSCLTLVTNLGLVVVTGFGPRVLLTGWTADGLANLSAGGESEVIEDDEGDDVIRLWGGGGRLREFSLVGASPPGAAPPPARAAKRL